MRRCFCVIFKDERQFVKFKRMFSSIISCGDVRPGSLSIVAMPLLMGYVKYVGPDDKRVDPTLAACASKSNFEGVFDVLTSHNAGGDKVSDGPTLLPLGESIAMSGALKTPPASNSRTARRTLTFPTRYMRGSAGYARWKLLVTTSHWRACWRLRDMACPGTTPCAASVA